MKKEKLRKPSLEEIARGIIRTTHWLIPHKENLWNNTLRLYRKEHPNNDAIPDLMIGNYKTSKFIIELMNSRKFCKLADIPYSHVDKYALDIKASIALCYYDQMVGLR